MAAALVSEGLSSTLVVLIARLVGCGMMYQHADRERVKNENSLHVTLSIQILQYEFLGPIRLADWGPPMGELIYLVMLKDKDRFSILYAGDCEETDDKAFFVQHDQFKCWVERAGSDAALHLAVFPMKDSDARQRQSVLGHIITNYRPPCNPASFKSAKPSYNVRKIHDVEPEDSAQVADALGSSSPVGDATEQKIIKCPCCGSDMPKVRDIGGGSSLYKCGSCGMSNTVLD